MKRISFRNLLCGALAAGLLVPLGISTAADTEQGQVVDGMVVYLGVLPAQMVAMQPEGHHEPDMHRGAPGWGEQYHVMVSLFDHVNWTPIANADVAVTVTDSRTPGHRVPGPRKKLERMTIAGGVAYGNYFNMPGIGPYQIDIEIRRAGTQQPIKASFDYRHSVVSAKPTHEQNTAISSTMPYHYVWLIWSSAFLCPWMILYLVSKPQRRIKMWWASVFMAPFGLTEPLFVPEYWSPPSLFELAQRTGFDVESIIFSFAIGGIAAVLYNAITRKRLKPVSPHERHSARHRWHRWALAAPFASFAILYFLPWNPIYAGIAAMALGAVAAVLCRPDLAPNTLIGGVLFLALYTIFLLGLKWSAPGYIEQVWNLPALSGVLIYGLPLEELLFGFSFGLVWTGIYEHFTWKRSVAS